jgi:hypothetical protein
MLPKEEYLEMQSEFYDSLVDQPAPTDDVLRLKRLIDDHWLDIDFSKKEPEWTRFFRLSHLSRNLAPVWFDWLKWVMMLAALKVVATKSGSVMVVEMVTISSLIMIFYFGFFFQRIRIRGLAFIGSEKWHDRVSIILGFVLGWGVNQCAQYLATAVATMSK